MIRAIVLYCMVLNPNLCKVLEIVPSDGHPISSQMECLMGGAIFDAQARIAQKTPDGLDQPDGSIRITYQGIEWFVKRIGCKQEGDDSGVIAKWLQDQKAKAARLEPQIK
jgi:hypothetical protein